MKILVGILFVATVVLGVRSYEQQKRILQDEGVLLNLVNDDILILQALAPSNIAPEPLPDDKKYKD